MVISHGFRRIVNAKRRSLSDFTTIDFVANEEKSISENDMLLEESPEVDSVNISDQTERFEENSQNTSWNQPDKAKEESKIDKMSNILININVATKEKR